MALSNPRTVYGVSQVVCFDRTNKIPYGVLKVVGDVGLAGDRDKKDLLGGSNPLPWDTEWGTSSSDFTMQIREFKPFIFTMAGYTVTTISTEASGAVTTLTNLLGTSVASSTIGVASVALQSSHSGNLKDGTYFVQAASGTTVHVYCSNDQDHTVGDDVSWINDTYRITESAITVVASTTNQGDIWHTLGVQATGGSGTIGMTTGDVATFSIRSINTGGYIYTYGSNPTPIDVGMLFSSQRKADGSFVEIYVPKVTVSNVPVNLKEKDWMSVDVKVAIKYDSAALSLFGSALTGFSFEIKDIFVS